MSCLLFVWLLSVIVWNQDSPILRWISLWLFQKFKTSLFNDNFNWFEGINKKTFSTLIYKQKAKHFCEVVCLCVCVCVCFVFLWLCVFVCWSLFAFVCLFQGLKNWHGKKVCLYSIFYLPNWSIFLFSRFSMFWIPIFLI